MTQPDVTTKIIRGAPLRDALLAQLKTVVETLPVPPRLVVVQVGAHPASTAYIRNKLKAAQAVGIRAEITHLKETDGEAALHSTVRALAEDPDVHAIIVQTPLPQGYNPHAALNLVPAHKDADGLSQASTDLRRQGKACLLPATPLGIMRLLEYLGVPLAGQPVAVVGKGMVVGAPLQEMLEQAGAHVIGVDKQTPQPATLTRQAGILISAAGAPGLVTERWVKPGAVMVDVGITRTPQGLVGDVDRARVEGVAAMLTPVPGGVGPLTVASLLSNVVDAACRQLDKPLTHWHF